MYVTAFLCTVFMDIGLPIKGLGFGGYGGSIDPYNNEFIWRGLEPRPPSPKYAHGNVVSY